ncbi:TetR/AcrR family transcriptional regulator [Marinobacterium aestuariivivens]|uniref:TetR/AcrR family transcriptional regulator n=1 Tax=Marinobacterium aestuariivivens TaxID=1698799 RepID=A0ABW1ZZ66_9GAMM
MVRRSAEEAAQTRQALLQAALEVFSEKGAGNGTLKEVAARAGVTHGALYWHFNNREAVLQALFDEAALPFEPHYLEQLQASRQHALEALEAYLLGVLRDISDDERARQLYRLFYTGSDTCPELAALAPRRQQVLQQPVAHIQHFLKQARKQKQVGLKKRDLEPMARAICCLLIGVWQSAWLAPSLFSWQEQGRLLIGNCRAGLAAGAP